MSSHRLSLWSRPGGRASWQGHCGCGHTFGPAAFRGDIELAHERHVAEMADSADDVTEDEDTEGPGAPVQPLGGLQRFGK